MYLLKDILRLESLIDISKINENKLSLVCDILSHILDHMPFSSIIGLKNVPIVKYVDSKGLSLRVLALYPFKKHATKFLFDILTNYLLPKKSLKISQFFSSNIKISETEEELTLCEIEMYFDSYFEKNCAVSYLQTKLQEIKLGLSSIYKAYKIIEMQGESNHEKLPRVQEMISHLVERFPLEFDYDIFTLMQQIFIELKESFKIIREAKYLVRMTTSLYLLKKQLLNALDENLENRHVFVRFKQTKLHMPLGIKPVLGVFVCLNFLKENEIFSKKQLFRAIQHVVPKINIVDDSFFEIIGGEGVGRYFYIEIEKDNRDLFSPYEITRLKKLLPSMLIGRIEHLQRPIFMPRNEEEVMKNIVVLSGQLKYVKDLPQVIISFEEQSYKYLTFTVILVRILYDKCHNADILLKMMNPSFKVVLERERTLGKVRHRYDKEALVMKVSLESLMFLREDDSVDLYKARQKVLAELEKVFGSVRDFNGGMISKQAEAFLKLKKALGSYAVDNKLLLENFFHSIYPIEMRSVASTMPLKELFVQLLQILNHHKHEGARFRKLYKKSDEFDIYLIEFYDYGLKQHVIDQMGMLRIMSRKLLQLHLQTFDRIFLGFIYFYGEEFSRNSFRSALKRALDF